MSDPSTPDGTTRPSFVKPGRAAAPPTYGAAASQSHAPAHAAPAPATFTAPAATAQPAPPFQPAPIPGAGATFGPVEIVAIAGMGLGWLLPGPGTLAGIVATLISQRWTAGEKALAILVPILLVVLPFIAFMNTVFDPGLDGLSSSLGWLVLMVLACVVAWPGAAIFLWVKARRRGAPVVAPVG